MCYVLRVTLTLLRRVILVREWWLLSIYLSAHFQANHKARSEIEKQWLLLYPLIVI